MDGLFGLIAVVSLIGWIATRYSIWCLPFVVSVAILAEDTFYPLSHFPMYSDPDESENYLYVADFENDAAQHTALPIRDFTNLSAPKVKKMWISYSRGYAKERDKKDTELTPEEEQEVSATLLNEFKEVAATRNKTLPERLALVEVWIEATDSGGWTETTTVLGALPAEGNPRLAKSPPVD